ncbi:MAG: hypothetical protein LQ350_002544 [Teloschistes chrysophthalmus]|nr:MAG: hypothetical protein LQ350_002544 [Niorma chrysophthalma]
MHCDICERSCSNKLPFNCTWCARHDLHQTRIQYAHTLLEQDAARSQIEHLLKASRNIGLRQSASEDYSPLLTLESFNTRQQALKERTTLILDHSDHVRADINKLGAEAASLRSSNLRRRAEIEKARQELTRHNVTDLEQVRKTASHVQQRWDLLHTRTAESRSLLCREAAILYGLQKQPTATATKTVVYTIGSLPIFNLKDLNREIAFTTLSASGRLTLQGANPAEVNAVIGSLAHLIHLISHYLALRLPAEIILPHRGCPYPTILPPGMSYAAQNVLLPYIDTAASPSNSASTSRVPFKSQKLRPKPQSLYLRKALTLVAKDDPQAYGDFVEGMALLAWNIAWLCKSQGVDVGAASWEGVYDVGKNVQMLLAAGNTGESAASPVPDISRKQPVPNKHRLLTPADNRNSQQYTTVRLPMRFGEYSHDTVHSNLGSATGSQYMHDWRLQDSRKMVERVKHMLQSDRTGAGWELLEGKEWEIEPSNTEQTAPPTNVEASTVVVNRSNEPIDALGNPQLKSADLAVEDQPEQNRGTSGWTKLKSR